MDSLLVFVPKITNRLRYTFDVVLSQLLGLKYDIPFRSICDWVLEYQGRKPSWREKMKRQREKQTGQPDPELPKELKLLQKELRKQQLHNKLLEEIIRIGGKETGIDWKKKFGTRQS